MRRVPAQSTPSAHRSSFLDYQSLQHPFWFNTTCGRIALRKADGHTGTAHGGGRRPPGGRPPGECCHTYIGGMGECVTRMLAQCGTHVATALVRSWGCSPHYNQTVCRAPTPASLLRSDAAGVE